MREIKCRGYNKDSKRWITGSYVDGYIINGVVEATNDYIAIETWCPVDVDTIGQYTGYKDEEGKEIYEGDKLLLTVTYEELDGEEVVDCATGIVEWYEGGWIVNCDDYGYSDDSLDDWSGHVLVVIGNIYE